MSRAEEFLDTTLEARFRIEGIVTETAEIFVFAGRNTDGGPVTIRMARALRGMSGDELVGAFAVFANEAQKLADLSKGSPNVEQLLAWGETAANDRERLAYCIFARTDGSSLAQLRGRGAQSLAGAISALEPIGSALSCAHERGLFHGDVRPDNLILVEAARKPTIKLIRFALATRLGSGTRTFAPEYGAPEHFKRSSGDNNIGPATDVYGLALCLVELVTGRPPLEGSHPTELYKQATDITRRPTFQTRGATVSAAVEAVVARALAVNPKLRWPTAGEFWSELVAAAAPELGDESDPADVGEGAGLPESVPSVSSQIGREPVASIPALDELKESIAPDRRVRLRRPIGVGVGVGAVVVGIVLVLSREPRTPAQVIGIATASAPSGSTPLEAPVSASSSAAVPVVKPAPPEGMVLVPAGAFTIGKDTEGKGDRPAHRVKLTHAFYIDQTEVTAEAYALCQESGACTPRITHVKKSVFSAYGCNLEKDRGAHPANCVDRQQAAAYCVFMKKRLPTEAEWEYAARGTDGRDFPWGNTPPTNCAAAVLSGMTGGCGERRGTNPAGSATEGVSSFGAVDMSGNVSEWVADDYGPYPSEEVTDPVIKLADARGIVRGGSWENPYQLAKVTYRLPLNPEAGNPGVGIRCAQEAGAL